MTQGVPKGDFTIPECLPVEVSQWVSKEAKVAIDECFEAEENEWESKELGNYKEEPKAQPMVAFSRNPSLQVLRYQHVPLSATGKLIHFNGI